jgi:hypothetical protein
MVTSKIFSIILRTTLKFPATRGERLFNLKADR